MNSRLRQILHDANGRYLTPDERDAWVAYAGSIVARFDAADAVEKAEDGVIRAVVEAVQQRYPNFAKYHDQGWARLYRDVQLVVRQDVHSMLRDDVRSLDDEMLRWLRSILASYNLTPGFCRDVFSILRDTLKE